MSFDQHTLGLFGDLWCLFEPTKVRFGPTNTRSKETVVVQVCWPPSRTDRRRSRDVCWRVNIYRHHDDNNRVLTTRVPEVSFVNTIPWNVVCRNNPPPSSKLCCLNRKLEHERYCLPFPLVPRVRGRTGYAVFNGTVGSKPNLTYAT